MKVKDHAISKEEFTLQYDNDLAMWFTLPKPAERELSRYYESENYISHTDASFSITDKAYQMVKKWMFNYKFKLIHTFNKEGNLLDIGAGTGDFLTQAKKHDWNISGLEPNPKARDLAKAKGIKLHTHLSEISTSFNVITLWHVLEHVYDLEEYISFLKKHLAKNGTLFIAVPNFNSYDGKKYKNHWAALDVPRHLYHFSKDSIEKLFDNAELELIETKPLWFDAFYVSILSEKHKGSNFSFVRGILTGLRSNYLAYQSQEYSSLIYVLKHKNTD